jgi:hypothetical protein
MPYLRYVKIIRLRPDPPKPRLYEVSFRDSSTKELSATAVDRAVTRHANILKGVEVPTDFDSYEARLVKFQDLHINAAALEKKQHGCRAGAFLHKQAVRRRFLSD